MSDPALPRRYDTNLFRVEKQGLRKRIASPYPPDGMFSTYLGEWLSALCVFLGLPRFALSIGPAWAIFDSYYGNTPGGSNITRLGAAHLFLAVFGIILPLFDSSIIFIYAIFATERSSRPAAVSSTLSLCLCSAALICSAILFPVLEEASRASRTKKHIFKSYYAVICLHSLALVDVVSLLLMKLVIPSPSRLPKRYKPFINARCERDPPLVVSQPEAIEDGPLAALFSQQQQLATQLRNRHLQQPPSTVDRPEEHRRNQPPKTNAVGSGTDLTVATRRRNSQNEGDNTTEVPNPGEYWPGPQMSIIQVCFLAGSILVAAVHVGIQYWRYAAFVNRGRAVTEYYGGNWQLGLTLAYPFIWMLAMVCQLLLYFLSIPPGTVLRGKVAIGDILLAFAVPSVVLSIIGIVETCKKVRLPPLGTENNTLSPRLTVWVLAVVAAAWSVLGSFVFNHHTIRALNGSLPKGPEGVSRLMAQMDLLWNSFIDRLLRLIEFMVLEREDRYPGRYSKTVQSVLASP